MLKRITIWLGILPVLFGACTVIPMLSGSGNSSQGSKETYSEDLTVHRPEYEPIDRSITEISEIDTVSVDSDFYIPVNDSVNYALDSIAKIRLGEDRVTGYTILVYSSLNREESRKALGRLYQILPDTKADLVYRQPYFRVMTGKWLYELHAYETLDKIKGEFPTAVIVPQNYKISQLGDDEK